MEFIVASSDTRSANYYKMAFHANESEMFAIEESQMEWRCHWQMFESVYVYVRVIVI